MRATATLIAVTLSGAWATGALAQPLPQWRAVEELRVGGEEPEYAFSVVKDLRVGRDGRIYVADGQGASVRAFDAQGRFQRWLGRRGSGPGEFRAIERLGWRGDTLYAVDPSLQRVTFFDPNGRAPRTLLLASPALQDLFMASVPVAFFPDGAGLVRPGFGAQLAIQGRITRVPLLRLSRGGRVERTLAALAYTDHRVASIRYPGGTTFLMRPLSGESLLAVAPDGSAFFVVDRPLPRAPGPTSFRVTKIRPRGDTTYARSFRVPAVAVPPAAADSLVEVQASQLAAGLSGTGVRVRPAVREALALPRFQPTVTAAVAGRDGTLWLRRDDLGRSTVEWMVLDASGRPAARVELPARVRLFEAERGRLWGVELDDLDVPWVVRYAVRSPAPPAGQRR